MDRKQESKAGKKEQDWKAPKFKRSLEISSSLQAEIKQREKRQADTDRLRADEVRRSIGLPTQEAMQPPEQDQYQSTYKLNPANGSPKSLENRKVDPPNIEEIVATVAAAHLKAKEEGAETNLDLMTNRIDWQIGEKFDAHGIAKSNNLSNLINLLNNGIDPSKNFHTSPLENNPDKKAGATHGGSAGGVAYKNGGFIVLDDPGEKISETGIKNVLVNDLYYDAIERLSEAYPDITFIRADQANEVLKKMVER